MTDLLDTPAAAGGKVWTPEALEQTNSAAPPPLKVRRKITNLDVIFCIYLIVGSFLIFVSVFSAYSQSVKGETKSTALTSQQVITKECHVNKATINKYLALGSDYTLTQSVKFATGNTEKAVVTMKSNTFAMKDLSGDTFCSVKLKG